MMILLEDSDEEKDVGSIAEKVFLSSFSAFVSLLLVYVERSVRVTIQMFKYLQTENSSLVRTGLLLDTLLGGRLCRTHRLTNRQLNSATLLCLRFSFVVFLPVKARSKHAASSNSKNLYQICSKDDEVIHVTCH